MAFEQNFIPKDLRPLKTTRIDAGGTRIAPVSISGRSPQGFYSNPPRGDISSPPTMPGPDPGFVGLGFGNPSANRGPALIMPVWGSRIPVLVGTPVVSSSGYVCSQNLVPPPPVGGNCTDQVSEEGGEDSVSGNKVKFLCSFGGKILPRPSDGMLRYVGGQTRIIGVRRDVRFCELAQKMVDIYGQPMVIKYQLPDEDMDALVSVSCPDDLENMMDEYEKLAETSPDGSAKLRVFLFSASETDASGAMEFGDLQDSGQRYVDAVNGIMEGVGGGITRKESIAGVTCPENSDVDRIEAGDTSLITADITLPAPISVTSPKSGSPTPTSNDNTAKFVCTDSNPVVHADSSTSIHVVPVAGSGPQAVYSQSEIMLDRTTPLPAQQQQLGYDAQQAGVRFPPPPSAYLQGFVDPHQDSVNHTDYQRFASQVVYANPQVLPTPRPMLIQQQYHDKTSTFVPQPFIHAVPISVTPSSSHLSTDLCMVPPLIQQRVIAVPADQSYASYQAQVPPSGGYGWQQVPPLEHVAFPEGWIPHQPVALSDKISMEGNCYICQKQLPHAYSDPVVQELRDSSFTTVGTNPVYQSMYLNDMTGILPGNTIVAGGPFGVGAIEQQATGTVATVLGQVNYEGGSPQAEIPGMSHEETQNEIDRFVPKGVDDADFAKMWTPQGVMGLPDVQAPYGVVKRNIPLSLPEDATQQHLVPLLSQAKQEALVTKPVTYNNAAIGIVSFKKSELLDSEIVKDYTGMVPGVASREDTAAPATPYDHMQVMGGVEHLHISQIISSSEQSMSPVDQPRKDNISHYPPQLFLRNDAFSKPTIAETNQAKLREVMPNSAAEVACQHKGHPVESNPVSQVPVFRRDDQTTYQQIATPTELESFTTNSKVQPSISQSHRSSNILDSENSLFSNQDPWNLRHDSHFPPVPKKVATRKETPVTQDSVETQPGNDIEENMEVLLLNVVNLPSSNINRDNISENAQADEEELIKQELQATAEGVVASVLQSSVPSIPDSSSHDRMVAGASHERELQNNSDAAIQTELEDINIKPDKANFGFPLSDGLGRLQIIKNSDLEELQELGSGTFGTVYHGKWRGTDVAIKRINDRCFAGKPSEQERMRDDFWNEAIKLADLHHPNVVAFYGLVLDGPGGSVATVTEYMVNGSLRNALPKSERNLDKRKRLLISMDVAFGMEYLHSKNIVHFDLKSDNLLVNLRDPHRPICKVGDLGLSKVKCQTLISGGVRGTLPWMAPELLNGSSSLVSEKVDVFSFGIVMWELLTGEEPYADLHYGAIIGGIVSNTLRPPVPDNCEPDWRSLMERCWSGEPSERPIFTEIVNELRAMAIKIPPKGQTPATNTRPNA
ncbi:hypothetical protein Dimus_023440 [Dionaea muscipula]